MISAFGGLDPCTEQRQNVNNAGARYPVLLQHRRPAVKSHTDGGSRKFGEEGKGKIPQGSGCIHDVMYGNVYGRR